MADQRPEEIAPARESHRPAFEELPEWFREEIVDNETRLQVDRDSWSCRDARTRRNLMVGGAVVAMFFYWGFMGATGLGTFLVGVAGALGSWLVCRFELCGPQGALAYGLPVMFAGLTGFNGPGGFFFFLCATLAGALLAQSLESHRTLHRGA